MCGPTSTPPAWSARGESDASGLLGGLAELAGPAPASTVMTPAPYVAAKRYLADLGDEMASASLESAHNLSRSEYFGGPLPADAVTALVRNLDAGRRPGQARELDFTPWGGAYTRVPVDATAFPHPRTGHHDERIHHDGAARGRPEPLHRRQLRQPHHRATRQQPRTTHRAAAGGSRGRAARGDEIGRASCRERV